MTCRVCDSTNLELAIDLGMHPWANHFLKKEEVGSEPFYPLRVMYCHKCTTTQLDHTVSKETMFGDHTYLSGVTKSLSSHFKTVAEEVDKRFWNASKTKSVLDIGSNDGTQLKHFQELGYDVLGVESSKTTAQIANDAGIPTVNTFFNLESAGQIGKKFHVINAAGVFFHLEELHSVAEGVKDSLRDDGVFIIQFLYMKSIVENLAFDQIYHEHLLYYNLFNLGILLNRHGLDLFDATFSPIHGGSVIAYAGHKGKRDLSERLHAMLREETERKSNSLETYLNFARRVEQKRDENISFLEQAKKQGKHVFGMGAPVKGNTLLNYFKIGTDYIDCLVEKNRLRRGLFSPGMHIPIVLEDELTKEPDVYYFLAWNFKKEILANRKDLIDRGVQFFFPIEPKD
ncbi:MAG: class I SAM-dependent methyltransferase [Bacteroidota bacterium]